MAKNIESEETKKTKRKSVAGKRLAKARHEKEIPLEDIAEELLVSTNVLSNLEKNIFDKVGPPVFVRGYLSQYAKIVDVPQDEILQEYSLIHHSQKTPQIVDKKKRIFSDSKYIKPKKVISILLLLLFFWVVWWLIQPSDKIESSNTIDLLDSSNVKENINDDFPNQNLPEDPAVEDISQSVVEDSSQESELSNPLFNVEIDITEEESPLKLNLSMNFIRECWIEVYDDLGDRLYYDLVSAGEIITLSGIAPLEILFGANESVEIFINGRNYSVPDIYVRANIARFRIIEDSTNDFKDIKYELSIGGLDNIFNCNVKGIDIYKKYLKAISHYKMEDLIKIAEELNVEVKKNGKKKTKKVLYDDINLFKM